MKILSEIQNVSDVCSQVADQAHLPFLLKNIQKKIRLYVGNVSAGNGGQEIKLAANCPIVGA
jgi:hypothetical protein